MTARDEYLSSVEDPLMLDAPDDAAWDDEADILVIGVGGAGAVAAIQARQLGADVIAIDRFEGGGATAFSGGIVYSGGTRFQREAGIEDDVDNMFDYLSQEECPVSLETLRTFCEGSNADLEWLCQLGVRFGSRAFKEKTVYPPEGYDLYYSGNEKVPAYAAHAKPAQRGHRTAGEGMTGYAYYAALRAALDASGARLHLHSPVRRLVTDRTGKVIGVEAAAIPQARWNAHQKIYRKLNPLQPYAGRKKARAVREAAAFESGCGERRLVRARRGIILATGGFIYNPDMLRHHRPLYADASRALMFIGSMGCDGSGIDLGRSVGAETQLMDRIFTGRSITPPAAFPQGILVDGQGGRFINEDAYAGFIGEAIGALPGGKAWLILDRATFRRALKECLFAGRGLYLYTLPSLVNILLGGTRKAASLRALAGKCGMDADALEASVAANNAAAQGAASDAFGKSPAATRPIAQGPFRAINMDLDNKFMVTMCFSLGGLTVDEQSGAVRRADGSAVAGLYGAGRVAVGLCSQGYISGMSLADTVFSGRRAARAIMAGQGLPDRAGAAQTTVMPPSTTSADPIM